MKLLELFCGTKSVRRVAKEMGWEVISLDIDPKFKPDICVDILDFNYTIFPPGSFDLVHASPPCTLYSIASCKPNLDEANPISNKTLEIIQYLSPTWYCIENPHSSLHTLETRHI